MLYIASVSESTAVTHSLLVPGFLPPSASSPSRRPALVTAKGNVIEVNELTPDGLTVVGRAEVWGVTVGLEWIGKDQPHIVVLTDHPLSRILVYRFPSSSSVTPAPLQLTSHATVTRLARTAEFFAALVADRAESRIYSSLYTGLINVIQFKEWEQQTGKRASSTSSQEDLRGALVIQEEYDISIREHNLLSLSVFNHGHGQALAFLYLTPDYTVNLIARALNNKAFEDLCPTIDVLTPPQGHSRGDFSVPAAKRLLALPDQGILVIGDEFSAKYILAHGRSLTSSPVQTSKRRRSTHGETSWHKGWRVRQGFGEITAATAVPLGSSVAAFLGDSFGRLTMITAPTGSRSAHVQFLGKTSPSTTLTHLDGMLLFVGSQCADSQVIRLQTAASGSKGKSRDMMAIDEETESETANLCLDVVQELENVGPIRDFCVLEDQEGSGSAVVTASGYNVGSLRVLRSGVGTETILRVDGVEGIENVFSTVDGAILTGSGFSIAVRLTDSGGLCVDDGIATNETTLFAQQTSHGLVQITDRAIRAKHGIWLAPQNITAAAISSRFIVIALANSLLRFNLESLDHPEMQQELPEDVSSLDLNDDKIAVGFWGTNAVDLYRLEDLQFDQRVAVEPSLPHSVRIRSGRAATHVFVGRGDGILAIHTFTSEGIDTRESTVGLTPVRLTAIYKGTPNGELAEGAFLTLSDKISLVHEDNGRFSFSSLSGKGLRCATLFTASDLGDCVIAAEDGGIVTISRVSSVKRLHIRKIDLGAHVPIGIAYDSGSGCFGAAVVKTTIDEAYGDETTESAFRLLAGSNWKPLAEHPLARGEVATSVTTVTLLGRTFFCLGSVFVDEPDDSGSPGKGQLRLFEVEAGTQLRQRAVVQTKGPVLDIKPFADHLALCVDNQVLLYKLSRNSLVPSSTFGSCFIASCLSVQKMPDGSERLHVGDGMRSVFALELAEDGTLIDRGRDMKPHWVVVNVTDPHEAQTNYNILTINHADNKLENAASFALHETVSKFKRGSIANQGIDSAIARPEIVFATSSGRLGIIADLGEHESAVLTDLQRNMADMIEGPGIVWRALREIHTEGNAKARPTLGFIDGDFLRYFLERSGDVPWANSIIQGHSEFSRVGGSKTPIALAEIIKVVETVSRLH